MPFLDYREEEVDYRDKNKTDCKSYRKEAGRSNKQYEQEGGRFFCCRRACLCFRWLPQYALGEELKERVQAHKHRKISQVLFCHQPNDGDFPKSTF